MSREQPGVKWMLLPAVALVVLALVVASRLSTEDEVGEPPEPPEQASAVPDAEEGAPAPLAAAPSAQLPQGCASLCPCCASGRDCGSGGCDALLPGNARFVLRAEMKAPPPSGEPRPIVKLCMRDADAGPRCTGVGASASGIASSVGELQASGLELTYELPVATQTGVFRAPVILKETLHFDEITGEALCRGLPVALKDLPISGLSLFLDPAEGGVPARCR